MKLKTVPILAGLTLASVIGIGGVQLAAAQDSTTSTTVQDSGSTTTAPDSSTDNSTTAPDSSTDGSSATPSAPSRENCPNMDGSSDSSSSSSGATSSAYRTGMHTRSV